MVETQSAGTAFWRIVRVVALSLLSLFLLGLAAGFTVAHLEDGGGITVRWVAILVAVLLSLAGCAWLIRRDVKGYVADEWTLRPDAGEGERLYADQRKRFWAIIAGLAAIGALTGFVGAFILQHEHFGTEASPLMLTLAAAGIILVAFLSAYASWRFFATVDELELADNLWGSLLGFYAYAILFPVWWALNAIGRAPEPDDWMIYLFSVAVALAAYAYRKFRNR